MAIPTSADVPLPFGTGPSADPASIYAYDNTVYMNTILIGADFYSRIYGTYIWELWRRPLR